MSTIITMPKLGLTMTEGIITRWLKEEGDQVKKGELLFEIETDKINSEVVIRPMMTYTLCRP